MNSLNKKRKSLRDYSSRHIRRIVADYESTIISSDSDTNSSNNSSSPLSVNNINRFSIKNVITKTKEFALINNSTAGNNSNNNDQLINEIDISLSPHHTLAESNDILSSDISSGSTCSLSEESLNNISDYSNTSISSDSEINEINNFQTALCEWSIKNNISHLALSELLVLLKIHTNCELPNTARTILKTKRSANHDIINIGNGFYWHYGVEKCIKLIASDIIILNKNVSNAILPNEETINILINIDGLPLTKSSNSCLWPILCSDTRIKKVYLIGAYQGNEKASDSNLFLSKFVNEINSLILNTYCYKNHKFKIKVHALICDAPAKSLVLHTKGHTGYNSCSKCVIKGEYVNGRICFPIELDKNKIIQLDDLRTDFDFSNKLYLNSYQLSDSILSSLHNFGMVKNVALDYMHLVCLGVVKKLIILWREGPLRTRIPFRDIKCISDYHILLKTSTPNDFPRKPRSLLDIKHWKSAEFRTFLLYTGPIVLKKYLSNEMYTNFLFLHVAISFLINPDLVKSNDHINYANDLLQHFV